MRGIGVRASWTSLVFLLPGLLWTQMPPQPAKLMVTSDPSGADVTINGAHMGQRTNATFVVAHGQYTIAVSSQDTNPKLNCPAKTIAVYGGQTYALQCTAQGWK